MYISSWASCEGFVDQKWPMGLMFGTTIELLQHQDEDPLVTGCVVSFKRVLCTGSSLLPPDVQACVHVQVSDAVRCSSCGRS